MIAASAADLFETEITGLTSEGAGVGHTPDGKAVFVHRTAPGDRVRVRVTEERERWARGALDEILAPGDGRRRAPCPFYDQCGGCVVQHLAPEVQIRGKVTRVQEALRRIGGLEGLPPPEIHPAPSETRYRTRVTFALRRLGGGRVVAGFHELGRPDRILDVDGRCLLPESPVAEAWDGLRSAWGTGAERLPPGHRLRLTLRGLAGGDVVLFVEEGRPGGRMEDLLVDEPRIAAAWHREEGADVPRFVAGRPDLVESWYGEEVPADPRCFLQPNREGGSRLHDTVLAAVGTANPGRVIDAYCGYGVYGRVLGRRGAQAIGIEADPGAVSVGRARPVPDFRLIEGRVEDRLGEALPADLAILNPPRVGVAPGVMEQLDAAGVPRIIYVSCDPATLARDLRRLGEGYGVSALHVFDLFPMTAHVETVAILQRIERAGRSDGPGDPT